MKNENRDRLDMFPDEDLGYRCYRLAQSHFAEWQPYEGDIDGLQMRMSQIESPLRVGWKPAELLIEIMLLEGFPLDSQVNSLKGFSDNSVQQVMSGSCAHSLIICLDPQITSVTVAQLRLDTEDIFICLDAALTDENKLQLADRCHLKVI